MKALKDEYPGSHPRVSLVHRLSIRFPWLAPFSPVHVPTRHCRCQALSPAMLLLHAYLFRQPWVSFGGWTLLKMHDRHELFKKRKYPHIDRMPQSQTSSLQLQYLFPTLLPPRNGCSITLVGTCERTGSAKQNIDRQSGRDTHAQAMLTTQVLVQIQSMPMNYTKSTEVITSDAH